MFTRRVHFIEFVDFQHWEDTDGRKNMSKNNSKGLAALRQKVKKYNKNFETDITSYKEVRIFDSALNLLPSKLHPTEVQLLVD